MGDRMKSMMEVTDDLYLVISEPGDATRYDYIVHNGGDDFHFMPRGNNFRYPQTLNYWDVKDITDMNNIKLHVLAKEHGVNAFTLMECIRTIKEIMDDKYN